MDAKEGARGRISSVQGRRHSHLPADLSVEIMAKGEASTAARRAP
jgi:hypothetical protein